MNNIELRNDLIDAGYDDTVLADGFDDALVGVSTDGAAVYDYEFMVTILVDRDKMDPDEAREYIDYKVLRAVQYYDPAPVIIRNLEDIV